MNKIVSGCNIQISRETHQLLVTLVEMTNGKLGRYADSFIKQGAEKELKELQKKKKSN